MVVNIKAKVRDLPKIRRVINGHVYNTESSSVLYRYNSWDDEPNWYGHGCQYETGLLQNVWGHYFIYYWDEDRIEEGYRIKPLTKEEAMKWAEKYCRELVEDIFGEFYEAGEGPAYTVKEPSRLEK